MLNISYKIVPVAPSKDINPEIIQQHFNWRLHGTYTGENTVQAGDMQEPVWWNRPLYSNILVKQETDGLFSYNLPYIYRKEDFKTKYNILVNKNSIPLIIQLNIKEIKNANILNNIATHAVYNALIELGVDKEKLSFHRNDLLYNNKKFMGTEDATYGNWYGSASIITLNYTDEKDIFKRLSGKYALARGITGIIEETNLFTKEQFIEAIFEKIDKILKGE